MKWRYAFFLIGENNSHVFLIIIIILREKQRILYPKRFILTSALARSMDSEVSFPGRERQFQQPRRYIFCIKREITSPNNST